MLEQAGARFAKLAMEFPNELQYVAALGSIGRDGGQADLDMRAFDAAEAAYRRSVAQFETLVRRAPQTREWRRSLALSLIGLGRALAATNDAAQATAVLSRAADIHFDLLRGSPPLGLERRYLEDIGATLTQVGYWSQAIEFWNREVEARPENSVPRVALARIFADSPDASVRDPRRAVEGLEEALRVAPRAFEPWLVLLGIRLNSGDKQGALAALDKATQLLISNADAGEEDSRNVVRGWRWMFDVSGASVEVLDRWTSIAIERFPDWTDWRIWKGISERAVLMLEWRADRSAGQRVPQLGGFSRASGNNGLAIWTEGYGSDLALMTERRANGFACRRVPQPDLALSKDSPTSRQHSLAVGAPRNAVDRVRQIEGGADRFARRRVP